MRINFYKKQLFLTILKNVLNNIETALNSIEIAFLKLLKQLFFNCIEQFLLEK